MNRKALAINSYVKLASMRLKAVLTPISLNATINNNQKLNQQKLAM